MAPRLLVTCSQTTTDANGRSTISALGGPEGGGWQRAAERVASDIATRDFEYFVVVGRAARAVILGGAGLDRLLVAGDPPGHNHLLGLPDCPRGRDLSRPRPS